MKKTAAYHHPDLRSALFAAALLAAALIELREYGAAFASLRRIAARAGVSHAAPYRHFRNKDGLLAAMGWEGQAEFTSRMQRARESVSGSAINRLFRLGQAYLDFAGDNPEVFLLMFSETGMRAMKSHLPPDLKTSPEKYDSFSILETTVKECQAESLIDRTAEQ
jgi:AcrR family transcriptional regulator